MVLAVLAGCQSQKGAGRFEPVTVETRVDTLHTIERIVMRDTVVLVAPDSLRLAVRLADLKENAPAYARSESGRMRVKIERVADTLVVDCAEQTQAIRLALADKVKEIRRLRHSRTTTEIPVPYVPWWVKALAWVGGISIALLVLNGMIKRF